MDWGHVVAAIAITSAMLGLFLGAAFGAMCAAGDEYASERRGYREGYRDGVDATIAINPAAFQEPEFDWNGERGVIWRGANR